MNEKDKTYNGINELPYGKLKLLFLKYFYSKIMNPKKVNSEHNSGDKLL